MDFFSGVVCRSWSIQSLRSGISRTPCNVAISYSRARSARLDHPRHPVRSDRRSGTAFGFSAIRFRFNADFHVSSAAVAARHFFLGALSCLARSGHRREAASLLVVGIIARPGTARIPIRPRFHERAANRGSAFFSNRSRRIISRRRGLDCWADAQRQGHCLSLFGSLPFAGCRLSGF